MRNEGRGAASEGVIGVVLDIFFEGRAYGLSEDKKDCPMFSHKSRFLHDAHRDYVLSVSGPLRLKQLFRPVYWSLS